MKKFIYIALFCFPLLAFAQTKAEGPKARIFVDNNYKASSGVYLKWLARKVYFEEGVNVYRKEGIQDWQKLNAAPIQINPNASLQDLGNDEEAANFLEGISSISYQEFQSSIFKGFVMIKAILNTPFAESIASAYLDKTAGAGKTYTYKITSIENGLEADLVISEPFTVGIYQATAAPQNFIHALDTLEKTVKFSWRVEPLRYYGAILYRSDNGEAFKPIHEAPIVPVATKTDSGEVYPEFLFTDRTVVEGNSYEYKLVGIDFFGQESEFTQTIEIPGFDLSFPIAPSNFSLNSNSKNLSIDLSWTLDSVSEDLQGLQVYRLKSGSETPEKIGGLLPVSATSYSEKVSASGGYYYYVAAVDQSGNESPSSTIYVDLRDIVPPAIPQNLEVNADTGKFIFKWNAVQDGDLAGYYIYRSLADEDNSNNKFVPMGSEPIEQNSFELPISKNVRAKYAYAVVSADTNFNRSDFSSIVVAQLPDVEPPQTPIIKNVAVKDSLLEIHWLANVDSDLKGYHVFRRVASDTTAFEQLNFSLLPKASTTYTDRQSVPGVKYAYQLVAVDENGLQSKPSQVFKGMLPTLPPQLEVEQPKARVNQKKKQVRLDWQAAEDEEALVGYTIYRKDQGKPFRPVSGLTQSLKYVDNGLSPGKYEYQVRSYSKTGDVFKSETISIEIQKTENQ